MASQQSMASLSTSKTAATAPPASTLFQVSAYLGAFLALLACFLACTDRWFPMPVATEELTIIVVLLLLPVACTFHFGQRSALATNKLADLAEENDTHEEKATPTEDAPEEPKALLEQAPWADMTSGHSGVSLIATASLDGTVRLWAPGTGEFQHKLEVEGHAGALNAMALSADGTIVATACGDGSARIWDAATGACKHSFDDGGGVVCSVALSPCGGFLLTGLDDNSAQLWRMPSGDSEEVHMPVLVLEGHSGGITSVAFSPCGTLAATGSLDCTARIWNVASGVCEHVLEGHEQEVLAVAFSPHGHMLATGSRDGTAGLWSVNAGWRLGSLDGHTTAVRAVAFSPCGNFVATGCSDGNVKLWDADGCAEAQCNQAFQGSGPVHSLAFSGDGSTVASVDGSTTKLWNVRSGACFKQLEGHTDIVQSVAFAL